ncbi:MAG: hypothetical protein ABTQ29_15805 [Siculibacillus sp.]
MIGRGMSGERDTLQAYADEVARRPTFGDGVRIFTDSMMRFRLSGPPLINKLLGHDVRFRTVCFTLWLHYGFDDRHRNEGATYTRLLELIRGTLGGSQKVVSTTLQLMLSMEFATLEPSRTDRRVKFYRPTPRMIEAVRTWLAGVFLSLDVVDPAGRRSERLRAGDDVLLAFIRNVGCSFRDGETLTGRAPRFSCFFDREGGWPFLAIAIRSVYADGALPSLGEIAARFGFSKTQMSVIAAEGVERGFLLKDARGRLHATPELRDYYEHWTAICFAFFLRATPPAEG